jgi:hypothetical protein
VAPKRVACKGRVRDPFQFADEPLTERGGGRNPLGAGREESRPCGPRRASLGFLAVHHVAPLGGPGVGTAFTGLPVRLSGESMTPAVTGETSRGRWGRSAIAHTSGAYKASERPGGYWRATMWVQDSVSAPRNQRFAGRRLTLAPHTPTGSHEETLTEWSTVRFFIS